MKAHLTLFFALLLICSGAAQAQTPDLMTPAQEAVCDSESGAAYGLCNAYCEAMDCESANPQASAAACTKVRDKYINVTGRPLPCEPCPAPPPGTPCPCVDALTDFNTVLNSPSRWGCFELGPFIFKDAGFAGVAASCSAASRFGVFCGVEIIIGEPEILSITPEEGAACVQLIREHCGPV